MIENMREYANVIHNFLDAMEQEEDFPTDNLEVQEEEEEGDNNPSVRPPEFIVLLLVCA
jgi:hypothetical protein